MWCPLSATNPFARAEIRFYSPYRLRYETYTDHLAFALRYIRGGSSWDATIRTLFAGLFHDGSDCRELQVTDIRDFWTHIDETNYKIHNVGETATYGLPVRIPIPKRVISATKLAKVS